MKVFLVSFMASHLFFIYLATSFSPMGALILNFVFLECLSVNLDLCLILDFFSCGFLSFVHLISGAMIFYCLFYMEGDKDEKRFIVLVFLFILSMTLLVLSPNLLTMMLGWDGLGITSFCLVIYYQSTTSLRSGLITVYMNRIGDVFMMIAIYLFFSMGSWDSFETSLDTLSFFGISFFLIFAAMTKSAQIPFSVWLPAAMAAPTPVSALVHSSTLVTAGVYLLIRFNKALSSGLNTWWFYVLGAFTMGLSGIMACLEQDFKKIIALSTLSQLGLMMIMLALGSWSFSYYHMVSHALFKSLLFLSSGVLLVYLSGGQDLRAHGMKNNKSSTLKLIMFFSCLSLMGFPFTAGFFSKDLMLEKSNFVGSYFMLFLILVFSCVLTVFYSMKMTFVGLLNTENKTQEMSLEKIKFEIPIFLLCLWSTFTGSTLMKLFLMEEALGVSGVQKALGMFIILLGLLTLWVLAFLMPTNINIMYKLFNLMGDMLFMGWVSVKMTLKTMNSLNQFLLSEFAWLESFPKMSYSLSMGTSRVFNQTNLNLKIGVSLMLLWSLSYIVF